MPTQSVIVYHSPLEAFFWTNVMNGNIFIGILYATAMTIVFGYSYKYAKRMKYLNPTWTGLAAAVGATILLHIILKHI